MSLFHLGQRVVCVDANAVWRNVEPLTEGAIYTIRYVGSDDAGEWGVYVEEITNGCDPIGHEFGYRISRFRPLVDIGWAHKIVAQVLTRKRVDA